MPGAGVEPARTQCPRDFKSLVSTNFTTRAIEYFFIYNMLPMLNFGKVRDYNLKNADLVGLTVNKILYQARFIW